MNIIILSIFYITLIYKCLKKGWIQRAYCAILTKIFGKVSDCIVCSQCENICLQHLNIIEDRNFLISVFKLNKLLI